MSISKTGTSFTPPLPKQEPRPAQPLRQPELPKSAPKPVADGFERPASKRVDLGSTFSGTQLATQVQSFQQGSAATGTSRGTPVNGTAGTGTGTSIPRASGIDTSFYMGEPPESPEQAAQFLSDPNNARYQGTNGQQLRSQDLAYLAANAPERLPAVFTALGPQESSRLLADTMRGLDEDNAQFFPNDAAIQSTFASVATALGTMPANFQTEVGAQLGRDGNMSAALILRQGGPGLDAARRGYLDAARDQAKTDPFMARAVGDVLAGSHALVNEYVQSWGNDFLTILDQGLGELKPSSFSNFHSGFASMEHTGLEQVVGMMANYNGPDAALHKAQVFATAANTLDRQGNDNASLRAGMDQLFLSDSRNIVEWLSDGTRPDDANLPAAQRRANPAMDARGEALSRYFRESVFENPDPNGAVVRQVSTLVDQMKTELVGASSQDARNRVGGFLGYLIGTAALGYEAAHTENKDSQAARAALVNMVFKPIAGQITGAASSAGGPAAGLLAGQITGAGTNLLINFLNSGLRDESHRMSELFTNVLTSVFSGVPVEYQPAVNAMLGRILGLDNIPG